MDALDQKQPPGTGDAPSRPGYRWAALALRDPLGHFLFFGVAIFLLFHAIGEPAETPRDRIEINSATIDQIVQRFERQWQRPPTSEELRALINEHVREEVLYREARAMGLDRDDQIVRRRLALKLEFLVDDLAAPREPTELDLAAFLESRLDHYRLPPHYSFSQVFFSVDRRGAAADRDAGVALAALRAETTVEIDPRLGDATLLEGSYRDISGSDVEAVFGIDFAGKLAELPMSVWSGPIESAYGLHLVRVDERTLGRVPTLEEIHDRVRGDWDYEERKADNNEVFARMMSHYDVVIEPISMEEIQGTATSSESTAAP